MGAHLHSVDPPPVTVRCDQAALHFRTAVGIGRDYLALVGECNRRGIPPSEWIIERIEPGAGSEEEEEIESRR